MIKTRFLFWYNEVANFLKLFLVYETLSFALISYELFCIFYFSSQQTVLEK